MKDGSFSFKCFILTTLNQFKWFFIAQFLIAVFWAIDISLRPYLIKTIIDKINLTPSSQVFSSLVILIILYILISIIIVINFRIYDWIILCFQPILKKHISTALLNYMIKHSPSFYHNHFSGSVTNKINDITNSIPIIINIIIDRLFSSILAILIAIYTVWSVNIKFAIGLIVWIMVFLVLSIKIAKKAKDLSDKAAEVRSNIVGNIVDIFTNIVNVCFFAKMDYENKYLDSMYERSIKAEQIRGWFLIKVHTFQEVSFIIFQSICFWWLMLGISNQTNTSGDFALILILNISIINCLHNISHEIGEFSTSIGNLTQGLRVVTAPLEIKDIIGAKDIKINQGEIIFENVKFYYYENKPLFENICLKIPSGQKVGLVGYSGSGKSTFVNLILRVFDPKEGRIIIDNQDIKEISQISLRRAIGVISQDPSLFHRTVAENIRYGKENASDEEIIKTAKRAHAHSFICNLTQSYNTLLGEKGVKLSGGERQRIAIARILLKDSRILILDEATSHLDSITESMIQKSFSDLMKAKTAIVIAHRLSTLLQMDRILVFDKGRIVQDGTHKHLVTLEGLYKKLWDTQLDGFLPSQKKL